MVEEKVAAEDQQNSGVAAALEVIEGAGAELAGDPAAVKEPGSVHLSVGQLQHSDRNEYSMRLEVFSQGVL